MQQSRKLFFLPQYIKMTLIGKMSQSVQLLHHEFLHRKLVDDALSIGAISSHLLNIEVDTQSIFILQIRDAPRGIDVQFAIRRTDHHIAEAQLVIVTTHLCLQVQRNRELAEHGSKGAGNILQQHPTLDWRGRESQRAPFLLVRKLEISTSNSQRGMGQFNGDVTQMRCAFVGIDLQQQLFNKESGATVFSHTISNLRHQSILTQ